HERKRIGLSRCYKFVRDDETYRPGLWFETARVCKTRRSCRRELAAAQTLQAMGVSRPGFNGIKARNKECKACSGIGGKANHTRSRKIAAASALARGRRT